MFVISVIQLITVVLLMIFENSQAYKLLLIPTSANEHMFALAKIGEQLTRNGHVVHFLVPNGFKMNEHLVELTSSFKIERFGAMHSEPTDYDALLENMTRSVLEQNTNVIEFLLSVRDIIRVETLYLLTNNDALMNGLDNEKFDVAVVDTTLVQKYPCLIALRLGLPLITYTDIIPQWLIRVPYLPSFVPSRMFGSFTERMMLTERFINTLVNVFLVTFINRLFQPEEDVLKDYRKYGNFSTVDDIIAQSLIFITTTDNILDYPRPSMPNVIHAAGLSVKASDCKSLPEGINKFMAEAKKGVILVTFGSMMSNFPSQIAKKFVSTFERLTPDYRIIFRMKNKDNLTFSENVMISHWLPQNDILADSRVKLFITHCGNSGQYEAMYHGVPMIGFPLLGDQPYNAKRLEYKGFGIAMKIHDFTVDDLYQNILTVLTDQAYRNRIRRASDIFKSAKETPAERAAYWIEHVTRFGGEHLRSAGSDLYLYQYLLLDVFLVIVIIVTFVFMCVWKTSKLTCRKCCVTRKLATKKTKKE